MSVVTPEAAERTGNVKGEHLRLLVLGEQAALCCKGRQKHSFVKSTCLQ